MGGLVVEQLYFSTIGKVADPGDGNHLAGFKAVKHFDEVTRASAGLDGPADDSRARRIEHKHI